MRVLVYSDEGVDRCGLRELYIALENSLFFTHYTIHLANHRYLIDAEWEEKTALLVMPGGRDIPYHNLLQGKGNQRIASFVKNGGNYLGICAGGYFGAAYIEFEKGGELEVCASRELAFFPGKAIGPAYGLGHFSYENERGARQALLDWAGGKSHIYFNGGCLFEEVERYPTIESLARYIDLPGSPAAVIRCSLGKGRAILSGVHPEYMLSPSLEPQRKAFWDYIIFNSLIKN